MNMRETKEKLQTLLLELRRRVLRGAAPAALSPGAAGVALSSTPSYPAVSEDPDSFLDQLVGTKTQLRRWKSFAVLSTLSSAPLTILVVVLTVLNFKNADRTQIVLSPAVDRYDVATVNQVTDSYIKAAFEHVAYGNSSWTYETIEENYADLFDHYYAHDLTTRTRANLTETGRFEYVKKNRMISTFRVDKDRSEYTWCAALNLACGLVVGHESTFIDGNQPFRSEDVTYLIFSESIYPTKTNPFALRITRLVIGDYDSLKKALEAAKLGRLPDDIRIKTTPQ